MQRIPTLDGWRGIAIAMVLFDHIHYAAHGHYTRPWMQTGLHGVTIFFVLSGFLITTSLLSEPINLKQFYLRRFFRLMPAAWLFLGSMATLDLLSGTHITSSSELLSCLFFYRNYATPAVGNIAGHFWSLSVEEQFYLVWPCLLLLAGIRRCRWLALLAGCGIELFRLIAWPRYQEHLAAFRTEVRADSLLAGCLLALLLADEHVGDQIRILTRRFALPALGGFLFAAWKLHPLQPFWECLCIATLIAATTQHPDWLSSRVLEFRPLAWLGVVSYSIYIWQAPFLSFNHTTLSLTLAMGLGLPAFALSSYYLVEKPLRRLGRRLSQRQAVAEIA